MHTNSSVSPEIFTFSNFGNDVGVGVGADAETSDFSFAWNKSLTQE